MNFFNKASKLISNYLKHDEDIDYCIGNIEDNLIYLNSQLILWKKNISFDNESFNELFTHRFDNKFMIYNLSDNKIEMKKNSDKIIDFKTPIYPTYTLEFLLSFAITAKNWLTLDAYNILIVHDDLKNPRVLVLLCTVLSYLSKNSLHPMDIFANIISNNPEFNEINNIDMYKNINRYINYFGLLMTNPVFDYKKLYLKTIILNSAPAIDNNEDNGNNNYLTINSKSFYKPVVRIISNDKVVFCSFNKNEPVKEIYYSSDNCIKFDINTLLFCDSMIEILHQQKGGKFKQLFVIQFNTFFINDNILRFTKDQIDGVCKDIRYPNDFFIDLIYDDKQNKNVSIYETEVAKWKNIISDFIMKSFKNMTIQEDQPKKRRSNSNASDEKEDDIITKPNTLNKAEKILQKFNHEEDDYEEDMEDYLKSLEEKINN